MKKPVQMWLLLAITAAETLAMAVATALYIFEVIAGNTRYLPTMLALIVMMAGGTVWSSFTVRGLNQHKPWSRSSSIFIQTAALAIAYQSAQPPVPRVDIAIALALPAVIVLALLFTKPLSEKFKREV